MQDYRWVVKEPGSIDSIIKENIDIKSPAPHEIQVKNHAIGVNMIDTYVISGEYNIDPYPLTPGVEGAGVITQIGDEIKDFKVGDRIGYGGPPLGAYSSIRNMWPGYAVKIPDSLSFEDAAAIMIAGLTAQMMVKKVYPVNSDTKVLVHAAAGSSGDSLVRWSKSLGATVFGTVGSDKKAKIAKDAGCDYVINYKEQNFADEILKINNGVGIDVVYDGIGKDTYENSFKALKPTGMFVTFGQASGPLPPIDLSTVPVTFSNFIARPSVFAFNAERETFLESMNDVFQMIDSNNINPKPGSLYNLNDAPDALKDLMNRKTTGSIVFTL